MIRCGNAKHGRLYIAKRAYIINAEHMIILCCKHLGVNTTKQSHFQTACLTLFAGSRPVHSIPSGLVKSDYKKPGTMEDLQALAVLSG